MNCTTCNFPYPPHELTGGLCLRCVAVELDRAKAELERVRRQCAAMREALEKLRDDFFHCSCTNGSFIYACNSCAAKRFIDAALQPDAGRDLLTREQAKPLVDAILRASVHSSIGKMFEAIKEGKNHARTLGFDV